ncbi:helix-turn-helix transcriptional regulator [Paraclostridium sordellii]|uniref:helix-turn-helix domain-containing protein n=1 Tax=Paraclostridium sordellii TaxID=1505 RepID=UPI0030CD1A6F
MKKRNLIGTNLKNIRKHNNLSQEQLIAQLNLLGLDLDRTSLSRIENHNREVYDYELVYFSKALKVSKLYVFGYTIIIRL